MSNLSVGVLINFVLIKKKGVAVIVVEVVVKAMVKVEVQLLFRVGGWSDKTKLILISTLVEVELDNIHIRDLIHTRAIISQLSCDSFTV